MSIGPGTRLGPYEIRAALGAGGMGEVYRARDTKLDRDVAIKILPEAFARDPERVARFEREAKTLAALNHPNIAAIYGIEDADGGLALVLELVDGPTLADRIAGGSLTLDDALAIARQIAAAIEAAHEQGIVHRDLKPANVKVTPAGTVKVLDFGLAKILEAERPASSLSMSPTLSIQATYAGVILGTVGYMSPEQARGKPADRRADIWAFGCVLYEMLTGRQVFLGADTVPDAVAAILTREPDWNALPDHVPAHVRRVLRRCLQKDPERRLHHIADARIELEDAPHEASDAAPPAAPTHVRRGMWMPMAPWVVSALAVVVAGLTFWTGTRPTIPFVPSEVRLELNLPTGVELYNGPRSVAVSPDGTRIAFVGVFGGGRQVYVRPLNRFEATPLRGTDAVGACFFSADGRSIGFITAGGELKTVSLDDGLVTTVTDGVNFLQGAAWGADGSIVFVRAGGLWRAPLPGGVPAPLTTINGADGDVLHGWPTFLPDGRTILFAAVSGDQSRIDSLSLATGERRTIVERGTLPLYAASGHLLFFRDGELLALPFDATGLEVTAGAVRVADSFPTSATGMPMVDVSLSGVLAFASAASVSRLTWVSRQGAEQALSQPSRPYGNPRLASDGNRIVVEAGDLWTHDLTRGTFTRLASSAANDLVVAFPALSPDGRQVVYRTPNGLRVQDANGGGDGALIEGTSIFDYPGSITPDGETLVFLRSSQETSFDILTLPFRDPTKVQVILRTRAYEGGARLSPDGRWLVYVSNESGQNEVYLRPFPGPDRRWQVSTEGGTQAVWNPNGREIFYRNANKMMAVDVSSGSQPALSPPRLLFEQSYAFGGGITVANYDVARDGQRFVMVKDESTAGRLNVVLNWFSDLAR